MELPQQKPLTSSDSNCENNCRLNLGVSEVFNQIVLEKQKSKALKSHTEPQIFDDLKDDQLYKNMLKDVMYKIFDDPNDLKVFRTALEGMNMNYPEILSGEEKNLFYCPSAFNFDSRIKKDESCIPDVLDEVQSQLEGKQHTSTGISNVFSNDGVQVGEASSIGQTTKKEKTSTYRQHLALQTWLYDYFFALLLNILPTCDVYCSLGSDSMYGMDPVRL